MSIQHNCKFIFILIGFSFLAILGPSVASAQTDTTATDTTAIAPKVKKKELAGRQLLLGVDVFHPVINYFNGSQHGYEIESQYYTRNDYYLALEGGGGGANVNYSNLQYNTKNAFLRFGFNKSVLPRNAPKDWDIMFIGLRAAASRVVRGPASYVIVDSVWGNAPGTFPNSSTFFAYWAELTAGMRVEVAKNLFVGWNIRGKFMLNGRSFSALSPLYIAGYGRGDKNSAFDFDLYVSYALRWKRKEKAAAVAKPK
jgi:hypothetical protein